MVTDQEIPEDVRKLAKAKADELPPLIGVRGEALQVIVEQAIMADRASRPTTSLPDTGVSGEPEPAILNEERLNLHKKLLGLRRGLRERGRGGYTPSAMFDSREIFLLQECLLDRAIDADRARDPGVEGLVKVLEDISSYVGRTMGADQIPLNGLHPGKVYAKGAAAAYNLLGGKAKDALTTYREGQK